MGQRIQFNEAKAKLLGKTNVIPLSDSIGMELVEKEKDIKALDYYVQNVITNLNIPNVKFQISPVQMPEISNMDIFDGRRKILTYYGFPQDKSDQTVYELDLIVKALQPGERHEADVEFCLVKTDEKDVFFRFSQAKGKWEHLTDDQTLEKYRQIYESVDDFCSMLGNVFEVHPHMLDSSFVLRKLQENQKLLDLYENLNGLMTFGMQNGTINETSFDSVQFDAILIPASHERKGCAIGYKNGKYQIYQLFKDKFLSDRENFKKIISRIIYEENSEEQIIDDAIYLLDHFDSTHKSCQFVFPISPNVYAQSEDPYEYLQIYSKNNTLTKEERGRIDSLAETFEENGIKPDVGNSHNRLDN